MNPPQPPQPHRPSTSCPRHPDEAFTGFCPSCLCERLALLDPNNNPNPSSSSRKPPSAAASALKALFRPPPIPELRRTKSFSASKNEPFSTSFEPQRKSCDVRVRSTLSNLFHQDINNINNNNAPRVPQQNDNPPRVQEREEEEEGKEEAEKEGEEEEDRDEIRVLEEPKPNVNEIVEEEEEEEGEKSEKEEEFVTVVEEEEEEGLKRMKDHIDLDSSQNNKQQKARDFKDLAGSFFSAASVFSKKLQKWRQKQKAKKRRGGGGSGGALPVEKPIGRQFRDTQSEIADYGFGRRSCDTDPRFSLDAGRFSLDAGRMSFDDPRYSLDEPRASWDGYLLGRSGFPRMPTMLSVVEDAPVAVPVPVSHVVRTDMQIPVEEGSNEDETVPGGSVQTREYYSDSGSRRRKSLDMSSSARKSVSLEVDELGSNNASGGVNVNGNGNVNVNVNAKVAPAGVDYLQGVRMGFNEREFGSNSMREDCCSEKMFDVGVIGNGDGNGNGKGGKKGRRWRWSIWGFIHRRGGNKDEDEDRYSRVNGVERSYSESWGGDGRGGGGGGGFNGRMLRSNSSVSWRNAQGIGNGGGGFGGFRRNGVQGNGNGKKGKEEFVLERNRSARYSPNNIDNGLLRFYLTPMRGSRRNGSVKSRSNQAHSIARSVLGLY